jgi:hypothetical protein
MQSVRLSLAKSSTSFERLAASTEATIACAAARILAAMAASPNAGPLAATARERANGRSRAAGNMAR